MWQSVLLADDIVDLNVCIYRQAGRNLEAENFYKKAVQLRPEVSSWIIRDSHGLHEV